MADIPVNWNLAQQPQSLDFMPSVVEGAQSGQTLRGISALQGIDLNDPDSLNKGIGNLVRAGAADQASALVGLQIQRSALADLPGLLSRFSALGKSQPQGTPQASPAPPAPTDAPVTLTPLGVPSNQSPSPVDRNALASMNAQMAADAKAFSQTPDDQKPAMAASLKQKYLGLGFPEASIDSALAHAATPGGADQLAAHYEAHGQLLGGGQPANPSALEPPGNTYAWAKDLLSDPKMIAELNWYKKYGIDLTGAIGTAQKLEEPSIAKAAEIAAAPTLGDIAAQTAGKTTAAQKAAELAVLPKQKAIEADMTPPVAGASPTFDVGGNHVGWHMPDGSLKSIAEVSGARASGEESGKAPYDVLEAPTGVAGQTVKYRLMPNPNGGPPIPTPLNGGSMPEGFGTSAGTSGEHNAAGQADALNTESTAAGQRLSAYPAAIARGQTLLGLAGQVGTGAYTDALAKAASALPVTNSAKDYAANAGLLKQDLAASFKDALGGLPVPRITSEAKAITGAIPSTASQQDQIKVYAAGNLAATQYQQARDQFIQQWAQDPRNPRDLSQAEAAWQKTAGGRSLFTMPAWQGVTVGGQPAVQLHQFQGRTYVIPLHGLLGKNATPILVQ